ncbi:MAG: sensor domain-containing diguanylate cyclase, partial [Bacillota bacterium]|nr:sensor domain-containing diguanylate cyclase [Bacillota bacterium]
KTHKDRNTLLKAMVEGISVGVYLYQNGKFVYCNQRIEEIFGYNLKEMLDKDLTELIYEEDITSVLESFSQLRANVEEVTREFRIVKKGRDIANVQVQAKLTYYSGLPAVIGTVIDITDRKKAEEKINYLAFYDSLTNLPNRHFLSDHFKQLLNRYKGNKNKGIGILFIDLDEFKSINDSLGHCFGDIVLQKASPRLCSCVRKNDIVSRYGGDEFILLLEDVSKKEIEDVAKRVIDEFSYPFSISDKAVLTSPSIGISVYPWDSRDIDTLIKYADAAMYHAKSLGKNTFWFYDSFVNI